MSADSIPADPVLGIGRELLEIRLRHRERRIAAVVHQLHVRVDEKGARGVTPPVPLCQALEDFSGELAQVRRLLAADRRFPGPPRART